MGSERGSVGIQEGYRDRHGRWQRASPDTVAALAEVLYSPDGPEEVAVISPGDSLAVEAPVLLVTEDGAEITVRDRLPS